MYRAGHTNDLQKTFADIYLVITTKFRDSFATDPQLQRCICVINAGEYQALLRQICQRGEIYQAFASRGQSLVPIMAIMSNTLMNTCV